MLISVCIPHYNRSKYLLAVLESIRVQDYPDVEVVISDDCSTDDSQEVIPKYIAAVQGTTHVRFNYIRQPKNLGYDGNLRAALGAARGEYLFVLGNDDCLSNSNALSEFVKSIQHLDFPDVCFTNFYEYGQPDKIIRRAITTSRLGSGPDSATRIFRSFSFVGGLGFKRQAFAAHNTPDYDGSIYVQIYLASRIIAAGGTVAGICLATVAKDFKLEEIGANTYLDILASSNSSVKPQTGGLDQVLKVSCAAILPYARAERFRYSVLIIGQILFFTYPFWLFNYREQGVYRAAVNLALGCFPFYLGHKAPIANRVKLLVLPLYIIMTLIGLAMPLSFYSFLKDRALKLSKVFLRPVEAVAL
jgi:glycosyltransferase involved in cell wall biosynthesis